MMPGAVLAVPYGWPALLVAAGLVVVLLWGVHHD